MTQEQKVKNANIATHIIGFMLLAFAGLVLFVDTKIALTKLEVGGIALLGLLCVIAKNRVGDLVVGLLNRLLGTK